MKGIAASIKIDRFKINSNWKNSLMKRRKEINPFDFFLLGVGIIPAWALVTVVTSTLGGEL